MKRISAGGGSARHATSISARPAPPLWRDLHAWLVLLALVPLVLHARSAPLGEPFMDDFDYLHRALFHPHGSFFDGYGSVLYWRPMGRQIYFGLLTPVLLAHPIAVPLIHGACLALAALLVYRTARLHWSGVVAAAMATFVLLMESTRMLFAWSSHFMDLGAILFAALALHEAARRRWITALVALLGSLLSKEIALTTALLLPWMPGAGVPGRGWRGRLAPTAATAGVLLLWAAVYVAASRAHDLSLPSRFDPVTRVTPWLARYAWSCWNSARALFSLNPAAGPWDGFITIGVAAILVATAARLMTSAAARARARQAMPWVAWSAAWFLGASMALTEVYPAWSPYRAVFAGLGAGIGLTAMVAAAAPSLAIALVGLRLFAFAVSPAPPVSITEAPFPSGAIYDFPQLVRLERLVRETRRVLVERLPAPPRGARVVRRALPIASDFAFAGDKSIQVWYRDSTLRWMSFDAFRRNPATEVAAIVERQPQDELPMATVAPDAMRALLVASDHIARAEWGPAHAALARAESLQTDPGARLFLGTVWSKRALVLVAFERLDEAEVAARRGLQLWPTNPDSRFALAKVSLAAGDRDRAAQHLDSLLAEYPEDVGAREMLTQIRLR